MKASRKLAAVVLSVAMVLSVAIALCSLLPSAAMGQATSQPSGGSHGVTIHTQLPRNNVHGGQIAAGRPGLIVQSAIVAHAKRQASAIHAFGGAKITATQPASLRDKVMPQLVNIFLGAVQAVAAAINAAITGGLQTTGT